jgi:Phage integrase, N-terminal SAM-like domain
MTQLRQKMLEELQASDYSHRTAKTYIRIVRDFAAFFHRPPDKPRAGTHPPIPGVSVSKAKSCRRLASVKMYPHCASCMTKLHEGIF